MPLNVGSLYVSLNANASAFIKGFRDATAAAEKAAKEIKRVSNEVAQVSTVFVAVAGASLKLAASVNGPAKAAMDGLEKSTKLLAVQVATMLLPAVNALTKMMKDAAAVVAGLSPEVKAMVSTFAVWAVQAFVVAKALGVVAGGASSVFSILKGLASAVAAIGVGPLLSFVAAIGLIIGAVLLLHRAWRKNWGGIQDVTADVLAWFQDAFGQFVKFMGGVWDFLVDGAKTFVDGLLAVGDVIEKVLGKDLGIAGMREGFAGLWKDLKNGSFFSEAFSFGKSVGRQLVDGIAEEWAELMNRLNFDGMNRGSPGGVGGGGRNPAGDISGHASMADASMAAADAKAAAAALGNAMEPYFDRINLRDAAARTKRFGSGMTAANATNSKQAGLFDRYRKATREAVSASSWDDAQYALKEGLLGAEEFGATLEVWGQRMGPMLAQSGQQLLGAVGDLVSSVVQGAQQGGVWGAILAAFMEIAKKTASAMAFLGVAMEFIERIAAMVEPLVAPIFDALTNVLAIVVDIVAPVFKALEPLFKSIGQLVKNLAPILYALGDVFEAISPILEFLGRVIGAILDAFGPIFELIAGVIKAIATVVLGIIIGLNELAAAFGDEKAKAESQRLQGIVKAMWERTTQMDMAASDAAAADLKKAAAADEATAAVRSFSDSLTNLPSGYRIQAARFDADLGLTASWGGAGAGTGGGSTSNFYGPVTITTGGTPEDGRSLAEEIENEQRRNRGQNRGTPVRPGAGEDYER